MELRYYEISQSDYLFALHGEEWRRVYEYRDGMLHFHNLMEIGLCREGEGVLLLEDEYVPYRPGMISVIPENYPHGTASKEGTESYWEYVFVDIEKMLEDMYPDDILFQQKLMDQINRRAFLVDESEVQGLSAVAHAIIEESRVKRDILYRESITGMAMILIVQLSRMDMEDTATLKSAIRRKSGLDQVRPALDFIKDHYSSSIKISELASECHMSESHFRRLFEENIGLTPVEYLNRIRILQACELIRRTGKSMEEVAVKVGFTTTSTFNRNFKRITGTSPYKWKKQPASYESRTSEANIIMEKGWE